MDKTQVQYVSERYVSRSIVNFSRTTEVSIPRPRGSLLVLGITTRVRLGVREGPNRVIGCRSETATKGSLSQKGSFTPEGGGNPPSDGD